MKYRVGDKLVLMQYTDPKNETFPIGTTLIVKELGVGGMYKVEFTNGNTQHLSEITIDKHFINIPPKPKLN
jgi:hypothetical protein